MNQKKFSLPPRWTYLPVILVIVMNFAVYYGCKLVLAGVPHHDPSIALDAMIPLIPAFVLFYVLAYPQWVFSYLFAGYENKKFLYEMMMANIIAKLISMVVFLVYPTELVRPELTGGGLWNFVLGIIYASDTPVNLLPSIHCLESWLCIRVAMGCKKMPRWYLPFTIFLSVGVFASVVFVKQHCFLDIWTGILAAEIGIWLSRATGAWRVLTHLELPFMKEAAESERQGTNEET